MRPKLGESMMRILKIPMLLRTESNATAARNCILVIMAIYLDQGLASLLMNAEIVLTRERQDGSVIAVRTVDEPFR